MLRRVPVVAEALAALIHALIQQRAACRRLGARSEPSNGMVE